jgi:rare lipoprotein A
MMRKNFLIGLFAACAVLIGPHHAMARKGVEKPRPIEGGAKTAWVGEHGVASYYGPKYDGRRAADGSRFDQKALTAAHPWLPFGTKVRVTLAATGKSVVVTITDRLYSGRRVVDLSVAAAAQLGIIRRGVAEVALSPA